MNSRNRVYLSKSNRASVENVRLVRRYLQRLGYDVIEHIAGEYDRNLPLTCHLMVMVGYDYDSADSVEVGKGQYEQLRLREKDIYDEGINNLYLFDIVNDVPRFAATTTYEVVNPDSWTSGYGVLQLYGEEYIPEAPKSRPAPNDVDETEQHIKGGEIFLHLAAITLFSNSSLS